MSPEVDRSARTGSVTQEVALVPADSDTIPVAPGTRFEAGEIVMNTRTNELVKVRQFFDDEQEHAEAPVIEVDRGVGSVPAEMQGDDELLIIGTTEAP